MKCLTFSIHKCHLTCKVFLVCFVLNTHLSYHFVFSKMLVCYYEVGTVDFFLIFGLFSTFKQILSMSFFHKPSLSSAHISSLRRRNHCKFKLASDQEKGWIFPIWDTWVVDPVTKMKHNSRRVRSRVTCG